MSRRRRAALLLGLALVLGGLAASDVARRERALAARLAPLVEIVVARHALAAGHRVLPADLAVRRIPSRFALAASTPPEALLGRRLAVPVAAGAALEPGLLERETPMAGALVRRGERAAEVTALAAPGTVVPGARVDVLVTRDGGGTSLALEDVEVLAARAPPADSGASQTAGRRVAATLRVSVRQAVYLAAAQAFAREIRLLARAPGDDATTGAIAIGPGLR
ncbi:MAG: pilus assembly protein CpaB [Solirubrobacteraceae bacterium]|nr:pilus assembly protein CpaB [Solirubrobacteraceae bacterium]